MLDPGLRENLTDNVAYFAEGVIQLGITDVENFTAHKLQWSLQHLCRGVNQVSDVNEGTPLLAIKNRDKALLPGFGGEQVDYQIEARAVPETKHGCEPKDGRVEVIGACIQQGPL